MSGLIDVGFFFTNLARFWPTFLVQIAVIVFVAYRAKSMSPRLGSLSRRLITGRSDASCYWCLPFYVWAWQSNQIVHGLFTDRVGLASTVRIPAEMEAIFGSLFHLLVLQALGTIVTRSAPVTLGLVGHTRTAVVAAMVSVFLGAGLFFWILG